MKLPKSAEKTKKPSEAEAKKAAQERMTWSDPSDVQITPPTKKKTTKK